MPKPYFIQRPSGIYVRFLVPDHARSDWGGRFIVKSLGARRGDDARLAAARLGYALSQFFGELRIMGRKRKSEELIQVHVDGQRIRRRITDGPESLIDHAYYKVEERLDGSWVILAEGPDDHENAMDMVRLLRSIPPDPEFARTRIPPPPVDGPMLEQRVELFLEQFNQKQRAEANKLDTAFTMRLFVGSFVDETDFLAGLGQFVEQGVVGIVIARGGGEKLSAIGDSTEVTRKLIETGLPFYTALGHATDRGLLDKHADQSFLTPTDLAHRLCAHVEAERAAGDDREAAKNAERKRIEALAIVGAQDQTIHELKKDLGELKVRIAQFEAGALEHAKVRRWMLAALFVIALVAAVAVIH